MPDSAICEIRFADHAKSKDGDESECSEVASDSAQIYFEP